MFVSSCAIAQAHFVLRVVPPKSIDLNKVAVSFDDGMIVKNLVPFISDGSLIISDSFYSTYGGIILSYPKKNANTNWTSSFFVKEGDCSIQFSDEDTSFSEKGNMKLKNVISMKSVGAAAEKYLMPLYDDFYAFLDKNPGYANDSALINTLIQKTAVINRAQVNYIQENGDQFYSLWLFRSRVIGADIMSADSLLVFFNDVFSADLRQTLEGRNAYNKIQTKRNIQVLGKSLDFSGKTIEGKTVHLSDFKGKFVLLNFWASWCSPCLKEIPELRAIRARFSENDLVMISMTADTDNNAFLAAVNKNKMSWIQLYKDDRTISHYGALAVPKNYLIGPDGNIIYHPDSKLDVFANLHALVRVLAKNITAK